MLVPDLLRRAAEADPGHSAAIVDGVGSITYGEWEARSNAFGRALAERITPGDRVALLYDNSGWIGFIVAYFAILKAGGVTVPVSHRLSAREVSHILDHSGARGVLVQPDHAGAAEAARPTSVEWIEAEPEKMEGPGAGDPFQVERSEDDLAEIIYTSGTTGLPKGVASPHGNITSGTSGGFMEAETLVHAIPIATFAGTFAMMVLPIANRWTNAVLPRFDPGRYSALIEEQQASVTYIVPAMARILLDSRAPEERDLSSLKMVWFGSAPMPPETLERLAKVFSGATLVNLYGLTEGGAAGTAMAFDVARPTSVGRPVGDARIRVVGDGGKDCAPGEQGEIWIGIPPGRRRRLYYRDPEASARIFAGDWVRTGDLGYLDEDGYLYLVDRIKDIVIRGGYNISSVEVEGELLSHPDVLEAAVVGIPHDVLGEDVAAVVALRRESRTTSDDLGAYLSARLADYKVPRRIEFAEALPRNAMGKVLKRELRERLSPT